MPDRAIGAQSVARAIQIRRREMTAYVEQLRRGQVRVQPVERRLEIPRLLLPDDQTCRRMLVHRGPLFCRSERSPAARAARPAVTRPLVSSKSSSRPRAAPGITLQSDPVWRATVA